MRNRTSRADGSCRCRQPAPRHIDGNNRGFNRYISFSGEPAVERFVQSDEWSRLRLAKSTMEYRAARAGNPECWKARG